MIEKDFILEIIEQELQGTELFLVDLKINTGNEIIVELDSDEGVYIDDCVNLSRSIEAKLDRDIEDFELEIGSAGLTSPFKIPRQYQKYSGKNVEVLLKDGVKMNGLLLASDSEGFTIQITKQIKPEGAKRKTTIKEEIKFSYEDVKYTKYLISIK